MLPCLLIFLLPVPGLCLHRRAKQLFFLQTSVGWGLVFIRVNVSKPLWKKKRGKYKRLLVSDTNECSGKNPNDERNHESTLRWQILYKKYSYSL